MVLGKLVAANAPVNAQNLYGVTPLHYAANRDLVDGVTLLLGAGADPHIKSRAGKTPLDLAKDRGLTKVEAVLVAAMEKAAKGEL